MDEYSMTVKSSAFLLNDTKPGGKHEPKEGYALSGIIPLGPNYVSLVYKRQQEVDRLKAIIEAIDTPKGNRMIPNYLKTYQIVLEPNSTEVVDILKDLKSASTYTQIMNMGNGSLCVQVNGIKESNFVLSPLATQIFNTGDLEVLCLSFTNLETFEQQVDIMVTAFNQELESYIKECYMQRGSIK